MSKLKFSPIIALMSSETIIKLSKLSRSYGYGDAKTYALKDFDLTVKRGEFIMIMGPSGCGKTTLLNILGLLDRPTSGEFTLNSQPINRLKDSKLAKIRAKKIGFIFQSYNLIPSLPIIENVALPLVYTGAKTSHRLIQASHILERFHLKEREYYLPHQLSGGQQQRAAIARSLVAKPEIILADEPTGNLDSKNSHLVMEELRKIHTEGNTIIMVTHNPSLTTYATRVIHMLDGQIDTDVKTVADSDLPQPISIRFIKKVVSEPKSKTPTSKIPTQPHSKTSPSLKPTKPTPSEITKKSPALTKPKSLKKLKNSPKKVKK